MTLRRWRARIADMGDTAPSRSRLPRELPRSEQPIRFETALRRPRHGCQAEPRGAGLGSSSPPPRTRPSPDSEDAFDCSPYNVQASMIRLLSRHMIRGDFQAMLGRGLRAAEPEPSADKARDALIRKVIIALRTSGIGCCLVVSETDDPARPSGAAGGTVERDRAARALSMLPKGGQF
jgi:hypothetical protein